MPEAGSTSLSAGPNPCRRHPAGSGPWASRIRPGGLADDIAAQDRFGRGRSGGGAAGRRTVRAGRRMAGPRPARGVALRGPGRRASTYPGHSADRYARPAPAATGAELLRIPCARRRRRRAIDIVTSARVHTPSTRTRAAAFRARRLRPPRRSRPRGPWLRRGAGPRPATAFPLPMVGNPGAAFLKRHMPRRSPRRGPLPLLFSVLSPPPLLLSLFLSFPLFLFPYPSISAMPATAADVAGVGRGGWARRSRHLEVVFLRATARSAVCRTSCLISWATIHGRGGGCRVDHPPPPARGRRFSGRETTAIPNRRRPVLARPGGGSVDRVRTSGSPPFSRASSRIPQLPRPVRARSAARPGYAARAGWRGDRPAAERGGVAGRTPWPRSRPGWPQGRGTRHLRPAVRTPAAASTPPYLGR